MTRIGTRKADRKDWPLYSLVCELVAKAKAVHLGEVKLRRKAHGPPTVTTSTVSPWWGVPLIAAAGVVVNGIIAGLLLAGTIQSRRGRRKDNLSVRRAAYIEYSYEATAFANLMLSVAGDMMQATREGKAIPPRRVTALGVPLDQLIEDDPGQAATPPPEG